MINNKNRMWIMFMKFEMVSFVLIVNYFDVVRMYLYYVDKELVIVIFLIRFYIIFMIVFFGS